MEFDSKMTEQRERSRTAAKGDFKGGLGDSGEMTTKYHTTAHILMAQALRNVLGDHVSRAVLILPRNVCDLTFKIPKR